MSRNPIFSILPCPGFGFLIIRPNVHWLAWSRIRLRAGDRGFDPRLDQQLGS